MDEDGEFLNTVAAKEYSFDATGKTRTNMGWEERELVFTADATKTSLSFANVHDGVTDAGAALDAVSVSAIPEPTTFLIWSLLGGLGLTIWRRR
jgi:hypothetical protein